MSIALVPNGGYRKKDKHSLIGVKWMRLVSEQYNLDIQHARNGGEVQILQYKVDGLLRSTKKDVFEFYGCVSSHYRLFVMSIHFYPLLHYP
jgi:hypothetical protein